MHPSVEPRLPVFRSQRAGMILHDVSHFLDDVAQICFLLDEGSRKTHTMRLLSVFLSLPPKEPFGSLGARLVIPSAEISGRHLVLFLSMVTNLIISRALL
jgi:hypothetical protein